MAVATTFMLTLGIGYTQRLVRYMGWWYGTIFALSSHIAIAGGCQKWLIFEVKIRKLWQASSRAGNQPGNHFMCHITSQYMGQHDLRPFLTTQAIHLCQEGVKNGSFFRSKSGRYGRPVPGQGTTLETILCTISPPNTWDSMT